MDFQIGGQSQYGDYNKDIFKSNMFNFRGLILIIIHELIQYISHEQILREIVGKSNSLY